MIRARAWQWNIVLAGSLFSLARVVGATPAMPIDDPMYLDLYQLREQGRTSALTLSAVRPLTESQVRSILQESETQSSVAPIEPNPGGFWA
jgi:hypothetical protein